MPVGLGLLLVQYNDLSGTIPTELGLPTRFVRLNVEHNRISGTVPTQIGMMTALTRL
jgi:hypothetical protein